MAQNRCVGILWIGSASPIKAGSVHSFEVDPDEIMIFDPSSGLRL